MTKHEQIVTELEQMDEAAYREWVAERLGRRPKKAEMAEWLEWRREAELRRPEAKRAWAAERERLRVARQASRALTWEIVTSWPWRETGGLLFLVIFFVGLFFVTGMSPFGRQPVPLPGVPVGSAQEIARFRRQAELMQTQPCGTSFRLYDLSLVGAADWYMSCPGCAEIRADEILPMAILEEADRWSVNGEIAVTELLQRTGECPDTTDPAIRFVRLTESVVEVRTESRVPDHDLQIRFWIDLMMVTYGLDAAADFERDILNVSINASQMRFTTCNDWLQDIGFAMDLRLMNQSPSQAVGEVTAKYFPSWYSAQCGNIE